MTRIDRRRKARSMPHRAVVGGTLRCAYTPSPRHCVCVLRKVPRRSPLVPVISPHCQRSHQGSGERVRAEGRRGIPSLFMRSAPVSLNAPHPAYRGWARHRFDKFPRLWYLTKSSEKVSMPRSSAPEASSTWFARCSCFRMCRQSHSSQSDPSPRDGGRR